MEPATVELNTVVVIVGTVVTAVIALVGLVWGSVYMTVNRSEDRLRQDRKDGEDRLRQDRKDGEDRLQKASDEAHTQIGQRIGRVEAGNDRIEKKVDQLLMNLLPSSSGMLGNRTEPEPSGSTAEHAQD